MLLLLSFDRFSILAVGSFPQTRHSHHRFCYVTEVSVSSLLDRFLRHRSPTRLRRSDNVSVSSLLDRFLRQGDSSWNARSSRSFSILAVGSFPQTRRRPPLPAWRCWFQYPRCWIVSSDSTDGRFCFSRFQFQYPRCWIVSSDKVRRGLKRLGYSMFQYPRCWIVSSDT